MERIVVIINSMGGKGICVFRLNGFGRFSAYPRRVVGIDGINDGLYFGRCRVVSIIIVREFQCRRIVPACFGAGDAFEAVELLTGDMGITVSGDDGSQFVPYILVCVATRIRSMRGRFVGFVRRAFPAGTSSDHKGRNQ